MDSRGPWPTPVSTTPGLPGPRIALSTRALPPHPGQPDACDCSLLPHRGQASASPADWPLPLVLRGRIGFAIAGLTSSLSSLVSDSPGGRPPDRSVSRRQLPFDAGPELHVERAIHMADTSQSARTTGVTWRNRRHGDSGDARRTERAARSAGGIERVTELEAPQNAPGASSSAALPMPLAGLSAGDAIGLLVDALRQPPCVSVRSVSPC
jgi:hypothetical protein